MRRTDYTISLQQHGSEIIEELTGLPKGREQFVNIAIDFLHRRAHEAHNEMKHDESLQLTFFSFLLLFSPSFDDESAIL